MLLAIPMMDKIKDTATSKTKTNAENSKKLHFCRPVQRQMWSLPDSIIYYITKNPTSPKIYQKLVQSCKYFYYKNPIVVVRSFFYGSMAKKWIAILGKENKFIDDTNGLKKFWITDKLQHNCSYKIDAVSSIIPRIYKCDARMLYFIDQTLSFYEFMFLTSNAVEISFVRGTVKNEDNSIVPFEELVKVLLKIKNITFCVHSSQKIISTETMKELLQIPHFLKIDNLRLYFITQDFDIKTFYNYMRKNKRTSIYLEFDGSLSDAYRNALHLIYDEILGYKMVPFKIPLLNFPGMVYEKYRKIRALSKNNVF